MGGITNHEGGINQQSNSTSHGNHAIYEAINGTVNNISDTINQENEVIRNYTERKNLLQQEIEKIKLMTYSYTEYAEIPGYVKILLSQYNFFSPGENETPRSLEALKSANLLRLKLDELNRYFNAEIHNINGVSQEIISQGKRLNKNQYTINKEVIMSILDPQRGRKIMAENSDSLNSAMGYCAPLM